MGLDSPPVPTWARFGLIGVIVLATLGALLGTVLLWPDGDATPRGGLDGIVASAPGVTYPHATVTDVGRDALAAEVDEGTDRGSTVRVQVPPEVAASGLTVGDRVELVRVPAQAGGETSWSYNNTDRDAVLLWLVVLFAVVVLVVARLRGLMAMVGLAVAGVVIWRFTLPALLDGENGLAVAVVTATLIMVVVLYTTHGFSLRTSAALVGTLLGVAATAGIALFWAGQARLTGVSDESGGLLVSAAGDLDFRGLLACAFVVAGLGVLNDVTITQASAVWELRAASSQMSRRQLWRGAMRIGRDHIASTIYTIAFAYAGSSLVVLMLLSLYDRPLLDLVSSEQLAEEVVRTLTSSIGLVLAVPLTTAVAVGLVGGPRRDRLE
ncbi:YibE/F family protein [Nocardioides acrostichi]|uniref:YibE/F family protein n=1 Tax=Nocardioides acrostichi TaxID=2784339 RepID=UPI002E287DB3|nr:YibE/F family protein [Nocardioides acrostichi]